MFFWHTDETFAQHISTIFRGSRVTRFDCEKWPKMWPNCFVKVSQQFGLLLKISNQLAEVNNHPKGENSPNLVTLRGSKSLESSKRSNLRFVRTQKITITTRHPILLSFVYLCWHRFFVVFCQRKISEINTGPVLVTSRLRKCRKLYVHVVPFCNIKYSFLFWIREVLT
jgi:hypothetical protein